MTKKKLIGKCPVCNGSLYISELSCRECDVKIRGDFDIPLFSRLDDKEREFIVLFLRSRGSLRELQRELGLSYPTVRNRLDALLAKMGIITFRPSDEEITDVLDRLEQGEVSAEDAIRLIRGQESEDTEVEVEKTERDAAETEARAKAQEAEARKVEAKIRDKLKEIRRQEREIKKAEKHTDKRKT
ncbi:DUF2089 family protein [candidate division WOR-3 bacterium]|nr:DUF2089 family protein [candidate division WOR-3 bacterium]